MRELLLGVGLALSHFSAPASPTGSSTSPGSDADPLTTALFDVAVKELPPGRSPYSRRVVEACGDQPRPTCELAPVCDEAESYCRPPRWSAARQAWLRLENPTETKARYKGIVASIARTAERLTRCTRRGRPIEACEPIKWSGTTESLALATLTLASFESGLREDIQFGRPPLGRGDLGEACMIQVLPDQAVRVAPWLSEEQRAHLRADRRARERFAQSLLGDAPDAMDRCFEIGMRMLSDARNSCSASGVPWTSATFAMYGTSSTCQARDLVRPRYEMLERLLVQARRRKAKPAADAPPN